MTSIRKSGTSRPKALVRRIGLWGIVSLFVVLTGLPSRAQTAGEAIFGVTSLDVAPNATQEGVALLKQYRDAALKQAGNLGVILLQEMDWPNRFVLYESWKDQAAYDANEKTAHTAALGDKLKPIAGAPYDRRPNKIISVAPAQTVAGADTIYMHLHLDVFPPGIAETLAAAKVVAEAARKGEGNLRFDVVGGFNSHSTFLAAWQNRKAFDAYETSAYGRQFRDTVGPLLGSPYDDRLYAPIN